MVSNPDDEFANFLDFGDLNFSAFDAAAVATTTTPPQADNGRLQQDGRTAMDTSIEGSAGLLGLDQGQMEQQHHPGLPTHMSAMTPSYQEPFNIEAELLNQQRQRHMQLQLQQHQQQHLHQNQRYPGPNMVPPTPNSIEMHGGQVHYYQPRLDQQQQQLYEHYRRHQKDQVHILAS